MNEKKNVLYVIKDKWGHQLSAPNPDDNELWDRVSDMEGRGRSGLCVVAYTGNDVDEAYTFVGEPDPTGRQEGNIRWAQKYKTWQDVYQLFMDVAEKDLDDPSNVSTHVEELYARGKGLPQWDKAYRRWIEDDRDSTMESLTESHDDTVEFVMQIEDMIRGVTPNIISKAFGKSYSFDLDGEGSAEDAMEDFRGAVHELAMAIYSMVIVRREGKDESLQEGLHMTGMTISDLIAAMQDNVDDSQMDDELNFLDSVNKRLGTDDAFFVIDDGGYLDPDYIDADAGIEGDDNLYTIARNGVKVYKEDRPGGTTFLYFKDENDYKKYARFVDDYYDEDIDEGVADVVGTVVGGIAKTGAKVIDSIDKLHS